MKKPFVFLFILWMPQALAVDMNKSYQEGKSLSSDANKPLDPTSLVPFYQGGNVPQAKLQPHELSEKASQAMSSPEGETLMKSHTQRSQFKIDPQHDPLFKQADTIVQNPEKSLGATKKGTAGKRQMVEQTLTCEEGGEAFLHTGIRTLNVDVIQKTQKYLYAHVRGKQFKRVGRSYGQISSLTRGPHHIAHDAWYDYIEYQQVSPVTINYFDGCNYYPHTVTPVYQYFKAFPGESPTTITSSEFFSKTLQPGDIREVWLSNLPAIEKQVDEGRCVYVESNCLEAHQTRTINGYPLTRPCWKEAVTYACQEPVKDTCTPLRQKGCVQTNSTCSKWQGERCLIYRQTFQCKTLHVEEGDVSLSGDDLPFCLDGRCNEGASHHNQDFAEVMSKLAIFKEMATDRDHLTVFSGRDQRCDRNIASFRDCCGGCGGWGVSIGLGKCSEQEKQLFKERMAGKCHEIGEYCAEKVLGVCIRKTRTYCCFSSKLARLIHEQGRGQIGLGWGNPKEPQCRGLMVEEMQRIDFSKIDLREIYEDLLKRTIQPDFGKIQHEWKQQWQSKKKALKPNNPERSGGL